jgi:biotin transporter BioY
MAEKTLIFEDKTASLAGDSFLILAFSFLTALSAKISFVIGPVPFTMQTFAVLVSGFFLGSRKGALSQLSYLFLGLAGLPWFSLGGGMAYLMSPTFGYILGFVAAAFLAGLFKESGLIKDFKSLFLMLLLCNAVIYLPGLIWLSFFVGTSQVLALGLYPFILGDLIKLSLAALLLKNQAIHIYER